MAEKKKTAVKFNPAKPDTWTWQELNTWVKRQGTVETLDKALAAEQAYDKPRLVYELRIQSRINYLCGKAALAGIKRRYSA